MIRRLRPRQRMVVILAALVVGGCTAVLGIPDDVQHHSGVGDGGGEGASPDVFVPDGGPSQDGGADAPVDDADANVAPACDLTKDFATPVVFAAISTAEDEGSARFSEDELTLLFDARRDGGTDFDVYTATRASTAAAFSTPVAIAGIATVTDDEYSPNLTTDGRTIFFERQTRATGISRILRGKRIAGGGAFTTVEVLDINSDVYTANPFVRGDGTELWYVNVPTAGGPVELFHGTALADGGYSGASVTALNIGNQFNPVISKDGLTIYFASDKVAGLAGLNIYVAKRATANGTFGAPALVPNVNSAFDETPTWVSADGCRLYISSSRPGGPGKQDVYVATRPK